MCNIYAGAAEGGIVSMSDTDLLDAALSLLVEFEFEMPCDVLPDIDDVCYETCNDKSCPQKECWRRFLEWRAKEDKHDAK